MIFNNSDLPDDIAGLLIWDNSGQEFCANINDIYTIINPLEIAQPDIYASVYPHIEIEGQNVPIINICEYLGLNNGTEFGNKRIVVVEAKEKMFGFFADKVKEVFTVGYKLKEKLSFVSYDGKHFIKGVITYKNRLFYLPDFQKIASDSFEIPSKS